MPNQILYTLKDLCEAIWYGLFTCEWHCFVNKILFSYTIKRKFYYTINTCFVRKVWVFSINPFLEYHNFSHTCVRRCYMARAHVLLKANKLIQIQS